jgi:hypothetical protein
MGCDEGWSDMEASPRRAMVFNTPGTAVTWRTCDDETKDAPPCNAVEVDQCVALPLRDGYACPALPYLALPCLVLSCLVSSCLVLSCLVLSCLVLSCLVLSCLVLSCLVLFVPVSVSILLSHNCLLPPSLFVRKCVCPWYDWCIFYLTPCPSPEIVRNLHPKKLT